MPTAIDDPTRRPFAIDDAVAILTQTPSAVDALLRDLPEPWTRANEGAETWSAFDIVGHLIHGERTDWMPRVKIIMAEGETRPFPRFDRQAQFRASLGRTLPQLLDEFATLRAANLSELSGLKLNPSDLARRGQHPELGEVTLRQLLATWVAHDFDHLAQISRVLAGQYQDEVGPWRAYLRVISGAQG